MTHAHATFIFPGFVFLCVFVCNTVKRDDKGYCYAEAAPQTQLLCELNKARENKIENSFL